MKIRWKDRLKYRFDNTVSRGASGLIAWLFVISAAFLLIIAALSLASGIMVKDDQPMRFSEVLWFNVLHALDSSIISSDTGSVAFLATGMVLTFGGIFLVSTLIGLLTSGIESKVKDLRKGRSRVCEEEHTVILGWSPQVFEIINELVTANRSRKHAAIAILAEHDKIEMEDAISAKVQKRHNTRIVCRTGSPIDSLDLQIVNPQAARAVIILSPERAANPDAHIIKTILALKLLPSDRPTGYHIVAAIRDAKNLQVAQLAGGAKARLILTEDLISRITVQTCRQSGLSVVYTELLDFDGVEIYMRSEPALAGKTFGQAMGEYDTSCLIGVLDKNGQTFINPPMDRPMDAADQVIVIAEDDTAIALAQGKSSVDEQAVRLILPPEQPAERVLILGWNHRGSAILKQLDAYVVAGSQVLVVASDAAVGTEIAAECGELKHLAVRFEAGDTSVRKVLDRLDVSSYPHVIVLSYSDKLSVQEADAGTLITLLHLRDISARSGRPFTIVTEMLDEQNRRLAEATQADDFIVGDKLISLMLSQVAENRELVPVFADLFDPEGSEIYLKPVTSYVGLDQPVNYYTVTESARRRSEIAIGYRIKAHANLRDKAYGIVLNPTKSAAISFADGDQIIVIAES